MCRLIREVRPDYVIGENVPGLLSISGGMVYEQVCTDLESEGYEVQTFVLPACATGAPHRRDRVWIVAYTNISRNAKQSKEKGIKEGVQREYREKRCSWLPYGTTGNDGTTSDTGHVGQAHPKQQSMGIEQLSESGNNPNSNNKGCEGGENAGSSERNIVGEDGTTSDTHQTRCECSENAGHIRPDGQKWIDEQSAGLHSGNHWHDWPSISPFHSGHDGLSEGLVRHIRASLEAAGETPENIESYIRKEANWIRKQSIMCAGNSIVPQVVYQIFKAIEYHNDNLPTK